MSNIANEEILKQVSMTPVVRYKAELKMMKQESLSDLEHEWKDESRGSLAWMLVVGLIIVSVAFMTLYKIAEVSVEINSIHKEQANLPGNITGTY